MFLFSTKSICLILYLISKVIPQIHSGKQLEDLSEYIQSLDFLIKKFFFYYPILVSLLSRLLGKSKYWEFTGLL